MNFGFGIMIVLSTIMAQPQHSTGFRVFGFCLLSFRFPASHAGL